MGGLRKRLGGLFGERQAPQPGSSTDAKSVHVWIRWARVWDALFYLLLAVSLAISLWEMGPYGSPQLALTLLTATFGLCYWFMIVRHRRWIRHDGPMLIYAAVAVALCISLIWISPVYYMLLFVTYSQFYSFLAMRWAILCSIVLTALLVLRGVVAEPESLAAWLIIGSLTIVIGLFFAFWIDSIIEQSRQRQDLIEELEETRNQLAAEERRAGTLEERTRLAGEIHDTLAQGFTSIVAHLEAAEGVLKPDNGTALRHLDQARETARDNLVEARHLVAALRPELLAGSSLPEALRRLTDRRSAEGAAPVTLKVTGEVRALPQGTQVALLRGTQEALANARKHAQASAATVTLSYMNDLGVLDVHDNGVGFDVESASADGGFGLGSMRGRAEELGGKLTIESEPDGGSTLVMELPAPASATGDPGAEAPAPKS